MGPGSSKLGMVMSVEPRTARGRATRERIINVATALVADDGVAGTSLDDVCQTAEVSKSQLYLYYADREDLLRAVAQHTTDQVMDAQADALAGCDSLAGMASYLDALVDLQVDRHGHGGCPIGTLAGQLAESDEPARRELADGLTRWELALRVGLATMARRGDLAEGADPAALATQVLALIQGGLLLTQVHRDPARIRLAADGALALIDARLNAGSPASIESPA
jgi:TetR/AcrR family transcriptional repressor of nem operon